ncbi:MAG TPA: peptidoglycan DD-metalloendopeptidase family protein [Bacteroidales bacterium]|nr:peptidoglycan DD-metalloendopeptidase family protein [Bacteroidales bacterium]
MRIIYILLLIICTATFSFGQSKSELEKKKKKTQDDINYTNNLLKQTQENQNATYNNLLLLNKNINSRQELISDISTELSYAEQQIKDLEFLIQIMTEDLESLRNDYAEMIRIAWKNQNKYNTIMFMFAAEDFNQTYLRFKYMQQLAKFRKKQFKAINSLQSILKIQIQTLEEMKITKVTLLEDEQKEQKGLLREQKEKEKALNKLKTQEQELKKSLQDQQKQMAQLQKEIEKLIAEETKRTSGTTTGKYELTPTEKIVSTNFGNNKGKLPWPVDRGVIVSNFGKQYHPVLTNVEIDNKGIDISTTAGTDARSIFDGEVRKVFSVPGAQNAVIIRHGEYLSVYTHLDNVYVSVGETVISKQAIGKIHTDKTENKTILHFEIWKGSTVVNPTGWLAR